MTKEEYADRKARRVCTVCQAGLFPDDPRVLCIDCRDASAKYRKRAKVKDKYNKRRRDNYPKRRAVLLAKYAKRRQQHKVDGQCQDCRLSVVQDTNFCWKHLQLRRGRAIKAYAAKVAARDAAGKCIDCGVVRTIHGKFCIACRDVRRKRSLAYYYRVKRRRAAKERACV